MKNVFYKNKLLTSPNENGIIAKKKGYKLTYNQLQKWKVKFHKLIFGKPSFDYVIDDKSINFKKNWYKFI